MLKYRGGKSKEISHFVNYMPLDYDRYIEPFLGGGALYFFLEPKQAIINDLNEKLFLFYQEIKNSYVTVRLQLDEIQKIYEENQRKYVFEKQKHPNERIENKNEFFYYRMRDMFNHKTEPAYLESVIYFFINKTAYSGMIRYNANGEYNVPFGRYKNLNTQLITDEHYKLLKRTEIFNEDYSVIFNMTNEKDFVFFGSSLRLCV